MNKEQIQVVLGGLFHDIGKLLYRYNDGRNHSTSGYEFLKELGIEDKNILDQVRYHHAIPLKSAGIDDNSLAYITYWADNVASGADRRQAYDEEGTMKYDKFVPLQSVFNVLNGNHQKHSYKMMEVFDDGEINYPSETAGNYNEETYGKLVANIKEGIKQIELTQPYINSVLGVMEANMSFVPSSSDTSQLVDISLFDHVKITAAIGSCIYEFLKEKQTPSFKDELFGKKESYDKNCFLMFSMDVSGVQNFIYQVDSEGALRSLRSKSFYLEIMLEHIIDELLERVEISRANLIYSGGGHAYIILPNTDKVKDTMSSFEADIREWFLDNFKTDLYVAMAYQECSANDLMNKTEGSYENIFKNLSAKLSDKKASRYSASDIIKLNTFTKADHTRECKVCGRVDNLTKNDICEFCDSFKRISKGVLYSDFITVLSETDSKQEGIRLPLDKYMVFDDENSLRERIKSDSTYIRSYSKNKMFTGFNVSTRLWVADYAQNTSFEELANSSKGIKKLGVLRADVDNLGQAFVGGFSSEHNGISRTATFSRKLNMFFKLNINKILSEGIYYLDNVETKQERNAAVVYSGGDDVFLLGAWDDVVEAAVDISEAFKRYSQNTLSISAGIGLFPGKYPVKAMARQTGELEDASKNVEGKNAVSLFESGSGDHSYKWDEFTKEVVGEKLALLNEYFSYNTQKGMSMLYKLMQYIRNLDDTINLARLAYMLGRMEPDRKASPEEKEIYSRFSRTLYKWISDDADNKHRKQLITAIYIYVYLHRGEKEEANG